MQYNVLTPLKRNGSLYPKGSLLELDNEEVATALIKDGVIEELSERPKPTPTKKVTPPVENKKENSNGDESTDSTGGNEESNGSDQGDEKTLEELSYQDLQKRAADLGLKSVGVSRDDLIANIRAAEANTDENSNGDDNGDDADDL